MRHLWARLTTLLLVLSPALQQAAAQHLQRLPSSATLTLDVTTLKGCAYYLTFGLCGRPHAWRLVSPYSPAGVLTQFIGKRVEMQRIVGEESFTIDKPWQETASVTFSYRNAFSPDTAMLNPPLVGAYYTHYHATPVVVRSGIVPGVQVNNRIVLIDIAAPNRRYEAFIRGYVDSKRPGRPVEGDNLQDVQLISVEERGRSTPAQGNLLLKYKHKNGSIGESSVFFQSFMMIRAL